jgi:hypothetical protein
MSSKKRYGTPHHCPNCTGKEFYGMLKLPHEKLKPCPNCRSRLIPHHHPMTLSTPENKRSQTDSGE